MLGDLGKHLVRLGPRFPSTNLINRYLAWSQLREVLQSKQINCVLDVGANRGQFAGGLRRIGYKHWIVSFEPSPDDFAAMQRARQGDRRWRGYAIALGGQRSVAPFNVSLEDSRLSSFLHRRDEPVQVVSVPIERLDEIFDEVLAGIPSPRVFLKMDTQGYDLEVVRGSSGCLDRIHGLLSEIAVEATYEKMPDYLESLKTYQDLGFSLRGLSEIAWSRTRGTVVEIDCLMIR